MYAQVHHRARMASAKLFPNPKFWDNSYFCRFFLQENGLFFRGVYYDRVFVRRRGVTALSWPKPKLKLDFKGNLFKWKGDVPKVEEINLQCFFQEPGENTYMRETVGFQVRCIYAAHLESDSLAHVGVLPRLLEEALQIDLLYLGYVTLPLEQVAFEVKLELGLGPGQRGDTAAPYKHAVVVDSPEKEPVLLQKKTTKVRIIPEFGVGKELG